MLNRFIIILAALLLLTGCGSDNPSISASFSDVDIRITQDERLVLTGKTTLPDGTKISSLILQTVPERKGLYTDAPLKPDAWDVVVQGGAFESWFPTAYEKGLKQGLYILQIGILPNQVELLGPDNSWVDGSGAVENEVDLPEIAAHEGS